jgi:UDP-N-acetylenolpyruvoylglucosamine reductase
LQYFKPENADIVREALRRCKRFDLIGNGKNCLVADDRKNQKKTDKKQSNQRKKKRR